MMNVNALYEDFMKKWNNAGFGCVRNGFPL